MFRTFKISLDLMINQIWKRFEFRIKNALEKFYYKKLLCKIFLIFSQKPRKISIFFTKNPSRVEFFSLKKNKRKYWNKLAKLNIYILYNILYFSPRKLDSLWKFKKKPIVLWITMKKIVLDHKFEFEINFWIQILDFWFLRLISSIFFQLINDIFSYQSSYFLDFSRDVLF